MLAVMLGVFAATAGVADAGKKRVVVLDFEGPKSGKFHQELIRIIGKSHTIVSTDKWNGTAEEMDAADISDKNIKKVAKKLKVDAVVEGKIEKRRDEYIIRLKLHSGVSGAVGTSVDTKADSPKIDGRAQREINDELIDAIASTGGGGGGDDDADDDKPVAKKGGKKKPADDDDDKPVAKKGGKKVAADDDDDKPRHGAFSKHLSDDDKPTKGGKVAADDDDKPVKGGKKVADDDDKPVVKKKPPVDDDKPVKVVKKPADDDDALPPKKGSKKVADDDALPPKKKPGKKVADDDDHKPAPKRAAVHEDDGNEIEASATHEPLDRMTALSPGQRFVDVAVGLSLDVRRLTFKLRPDLRAKPPNYTGAGVPGYAGAITAYPLAFGHTRDDVLKDIGLTFEGSRAFKVTTNLPLKDSVQHFKSFDSRFGIGGVFRFAFGEGSGAPVLIGGLMYTDQRFSITADSAHNTSGIPNVRYKMVEPNISFKLPIAGKFIASVNGRIMAMLDTGQQQSQNYYGTTKVTGYEGTLGLDYAVTPNIFARVEGHIEGINLQYTGNGTMQINRDGDPTSIDVMSARDVYFGGFATVGYVY